MLNTRLSPSECLCSDVKDCLIFFFLFDICGAWDCVLKKQAKGFHVKIWYHCFKALGNLRLTEIRHNLKSFTNCIFYWILKNQMSGGRSHQRCRFCQVVSLVMVSLSLIVYSKHYTPSMPALCAIHSHYEPYMAALWLQYVSSMVNMGQSVVVLW